MFRELCWLSERSSQNLAQFVCLLRIVELTETLKNVAPFVLAPLL